MSQLEPVCPACHSELVNRNGDGCQCVRCRTVYPKRAEVDVFLTDEEWLACRAHLASEERILEKYEFARRNNPLTVRYYDWWVARMLQEVPENIGGSLVELMCGGAEVCRRLPARFTSAFALDLNVGSVENAAKSLVHAGETRVQLVCGTAARVPLPDACADVVMIQGALHHARPQLRDVLGEVHRLLKPNGVYVGSEPANDHWLTRGIRHWQYRHSSMQGHDPDEDGFSQTELATFLSQAGLRLDRYRQFGFVAYPLLGNADILPLFASARWSWLQRPLMAIDDWMERIPLMQRLAWASLFRVVKD